MKQSDLVFRVDSSADIGTGHLMRCLTLAKYLKSQEYKVAFICGQIDVQFSNILSNLAIPVSYIEQFGEDIAPLETCCDPTHPQIVSQYENWLAVPWDVDAAATVSILERFDHPTLIVDHYGIDYRWERVVQKSTGKLVVIDDLANRVHDCDILIDASFTRTVADYSKSNIRDTFLLGPNFAIQNQEFPVIRERKIHPAESDKKSLKGLIYFGGCDRDGLTLRAIAVLRECCNLSFSVIISDLSCGYSDVVEICTMDPRFNQVDFTENMPQFLAAHDFVIGAGGTSCWERATLGLPQILLQVAENQRENCSALVKLGNAILVDSQQLDKELPASLDELSHNFEAMSKSGLQASDGLGIFRIASYLKYADDGNANHQLYLRKATLEDAHLIYDWRTDASVRRRSTNNEIFSFESHLDFLKKRLSDPGCYLYMGVDAKSGCEVSCVRLDRQYYSEYEVSIFVDPNNKNKKYGLKSLLLINDWHSIHSIKARIESSNCASKKIFYAAGYLPVGKDLYEKSSIKIT